MRCFFRADADPPNVRTERTAATTPYARLRATPFQLGLPPGDDAMTPSPVCRPSLPKFRVGAPNAQALCKIGSGIEV